MLRLDSAAGGRLGGPVHAGPPVRALDPLADEGPLVWRRGRPLVGQTLGWMVRGYQQANAGDLAAAVAFHALVALVPTFLLCLSVAGLFLRSDEVLVGALRASAWGLPSGAAGEAFEAVLAARRNSGWFGALSLAGFAWTGAGFVSCLARSMNRVYGVPGCGYMCERRRGFFVVIAFAALFLLALFASTVPTLFVGQDLPFYFEGWVLADGGAQALGYVLAVPVTGALFAMLYRVVPNAGQRLADVWPGTLTAAVAFVVIAQVFPVYFRLIGGANRYGAVFGLVSLLVAWFYALSHVLLFGAYVNATHQRHRRRVARGRTEAGCAGCVG